MNIIVKTAGGAVIVRPDTTWERDNEDVFLPEFVTRVSCTPVLFARISKPGRSVSAKFADRYYDGIGYGALLYPENMIDGSETGFACASCIDHTSFLPFPVYSKETLGRAGNSFCMDLDGKRIFETEGSAERSVIEKAIEEATRFCYIRTGDILAIELESRKEIIARTQEGGSCTLSGTYCGNSVLDFKIIL